MKRFEFILNLICFFVFFIGISLVPKEVRADGFALPLDCEQGFSFQSDTNHVTPFLFSSKLTPEYRLSNFGAGVILSPRYSNPNWDAGFGARLTWLFWNFLPDSGIRLSIDGIHWVNTPNSTLEFGLVGDLSGLPRFGLWYGFDTQSNASSLMLSIGLDIVSVIKVLNPNVPQPNFN